MRAIANCFFVAALVLLIDGCDYRADLPEDDDAGAVDPCEGSCGEGTVCGEQESGTHGCVLPPDPCLVCGTGTDCQLDEEGSVSCVPADVEQENDSEPDPEPGSEDACGNVCQVGTVCEGGTCVLDDEPEPDSEPEQDACDDLCGEGLVCGEEDGAPRCITAPDACQDLCGEGTICEGGTCVAIEDEELEAQADAGVDETDDAGTDSGQDDCLGLCGTDTVCEDGQCIPAQDPEPEEDPCGDVCGTGSVCGEVDGLPMCVPTTDPDPDDENDGDPVSSVCDGDPLCWDGTRFCVVSAPLAQEVNAPVPTGQSSNETTAGLYGDVYASQDAYMVGEDLGWTVSASDRFSYEDGYLCRDFAGMNAGTYRFTLVSAFDKYLSVSCTNGTLLPLYQSGGTTYGICPIDGNTALSSYVWHHNETICDGIANDLDASCEQVSGGWRFVAVYDG